MKKRNSIVDAVAVVCVLMLIAALMTTSRGAHRRTVTVVAASTTTSAVPAPVRIPPAYDPPPVLPTPAEVRAALATPIKRLKRALGIIGSDSRYYTVAGSDANSCANSSTQACRTPARACQQLTAGGGTVFGGTGTYSGTTINTTLIAQMIDQCPAHTRLTSIDPANPAKWAHSGTGENLILAFGQSLDDFEVDHMEFDGGSQTSCVAPWSSTDCQRNTLLKLRDGVSNVYIHDNKFYGGIQSCIYAGSRTYDADPLPNVRNVAFVRNEVYNCGNGREASSHALGSYTHGFYIKDVRLSGGGALGSGVGLLMQDNYIHDNTGYGMQIYGNNSASAFASGLIERNRVTGNGTVTGGGVVLSWASDILFRNNVISGNSTGLWVDPAVNGLRLDHNTIANNTYVGSNDQGYHYAVVSVQSASPQMNYNAIQGHPSGQILHTNDGGVFSGDRNIVAGTQVVGGGSLAFSNTLVTPASFVSSTDYHLTAGSSGINAATGSGEALDLDQATRPVAVVNDVGAYEYGGTPGPTTIPPASTTTSTTTTSVVPTTVGNGRLITLVAFRDGNVNGVRDIGEGPMTGAIWRIRTSTGKIVAGGNIPSAGGTGTVTVAVIAVPGMTASISPPVGQGATTPTVVQLPDTGPATVTVGGCCARFLG